MNATDGATKVYTSADDVPTMEAGTGVGLGVAVGAGEAVDAGNGVNVGCGVAVGTGVAVGVGTGTRVLVGSAVEPVAAVEGPGCSPQETAIARAHRTASNPKYPGQCAIRSMEKPYPSPYVQVAALGWALYTSQCRGIGSRNAVVCGLACSAISQSILQIPSTLEGKAEDGSFKIGETGHQMHDKCNYRADQLALIRDFGNSGPTDRLS